MKFIQFVWITLFLTLPQRRPKLMTTTNVAFLALLVMFLLVPISASAAVTGDDFQDLYDFFYEAATGYLGRAIALVGGLMGLGVGAATGKPVPALMGIVLAIFGTMGPTLVNNLFDSATI